MINSLQAVVLPKSYGFNFDNDQYNNPLSEFTGDVGTPGVFYGSIGNNGLLNLRSTGSRSEIVYADNYKEIDAAYTINTRIRPLVYDTAGWNYRIFVRNGSHELKLFFKSGGIYSRNPSGSLVKVANALSTAWHDITVDVIDANAKLYVNGIQKAQFTLQASTAPDHLELCSYSPNNEQRVQVDHFFLHNEFKELFFDESDRFAVTQSLTFPNGEVFGINDNGGGYGSSFQFSNNSPNLVKTGYGAGWIHGTRSKMHGNHYNPMISGITATIGVKSDVYVLNGGKRLSIPPTGCVLHLGEAQFHDWIENEPWVNTDGSLRYDLNNNDGDNSDVDGFAEHQLLMDNELQTEMDALCQWENVTPNGGISTMRAYQENRYVRNPAGILQFSKASGAIDEDWRVKDLSAAQPGLQVPSDRDISYMLQKYSFRTKTDTANPNNNYDTIMWKQGGVWKTETLIVGPSVFLELVGPTSNQNLVGPGGLLVGGFSNAPDNNCFIIAKGRGKNLGEAIGYVFPQSAINTYSTLRRNRSTNGVIASEDRMINTWVQARLRNDRTIITVTAAHLGLKAPEGNTYESLRMEGYHLFGTPNQIIAAAQNL